MMVSGNEAIAYGALHAGVKLVSGYPGTPSSEVIGCLMNMELEGTHVEWSVNEKVAVETAAAAGWAGHRALCTMKMSGLNVAYDALIGFAYSGTTGGLVIYVTDDPGATTGMCEQDSRGFALMSDMVMLEPDSVKQSYEMIQTAFEISESIGSPVFVRSVTNVAQAHAPLEIEKRAMPSSKTVLIRDIQRFTKAGSVIATNQHKRLIASLEKASAIIEQKGLNILKLGEKDGLGIVSVGSLNKIAEEAVELANENGCCFEPGSISTLRLACTIPYAHSEMDRIIGHCSAVIVLEELEPYVEREIIVRAFRANKNIRVIGKLDGTYPRSGEYNAAVAAVGLFAYSNVPVPEHFVTGDPLPAQKCAARPITCCAGCPHRGTYLSIKQAIKEEGFKPEDVLVTGDVGCTILGMNPPFHILWTETAMGSSIPTAAGYKLSGLETPVIATIGDSTFFHAGIPPLINAVQHEVDMTVIIMDNGWTAMTGMQVNPGTEQANEGKQHRRIDIYNVLEGLDIENIYVTDPYDTGGMTKTLREALNQKGVKVVLARRECAIQAARRGARHSYAAINKDLCTKCKRCISMTGCPAIAVADGMVTIDRELCNGCSICFNACPFKAIERKLL